MSYFFLSACQRRAERPCGCAYILPFRLFWTFACTLSLLCHKSDLYPVSNTAQVNGGRNMNRIAGSFVMSLVLILVPVGPLVYGQGTSNEAQTARIKAEITKRASNEKSLVTIRLRNGSEVRGRITQTSENMFTLREDKARGQRDFNYSEVMKIKGRGLSRGAKFGILTAIVTGAVVIGALISLKKFDPFENGVLR